MKTASKTDTKLINHLLMTPSRLTVLTSPRQSGVTRGIIEYSSTLVSCDYKVAILGRRGSVCDEIIKMISLYGNDKVDVLLCSTIKKTDFNEYSVRNHRNNKWVKLSDYKHIFVDDAFWVLEQSINIAEYAASNPNLSLTLASTGCNVNDWWKNVNYFKSIGFTSLIANPFRHPHFISDMKCSYGFKNFNAEYETFDYDEYKTTAPKD